MKEELSNSETKKWRLEKIKELEEKEDRSGFEDSLIKFLKDNTVEKHLRDIFFQLNSSIDYYMDDTPENIVIYSLWIIGTYFHKEFQTYPYLFLNAMRGSGKSRLLKLLAFIGNGRYTSSLTEAIVFRTQGLLCVDEIESIGSKDKSTLRELLNASYKKGMSIMRTIKRKDLGGETFKIEEFEPYRPIAMANIWGMEEVLGDRCITRILEKSDDPLKTKRIENFEDNPELCLIKVKLVQCSLCSVVSKKYIQLWNRFLDKLHLYTNNINYTNYTNYTFTQEELDFFNKINDSNIFGRSLELFMPLLVVANNIGEDVFNTTLDIFKKINDEKKETELSESVDVLVYDFVARFESGLEFIPIRQLFNQFKDFSELNEDWLNDKWFGRALKRLNLVVDKRRKNKGMEVILNSVKAREKIKMFQKSPKDLNSN